MCSQRSALPLAMVLLLAYAAAPGFPPPGLQDAHLAVMRSTATKPPGSASPPAPPLPPADPLCPHGPPLNMSLFFFHPPSDPSTPVAWANHDYGDALGEAVRPPAANLTNLALA